MTILEIACEASCLMEIDELKPFQGALKSLSKENYNRLRAEMLADGFSFPVFVWKHDGSNFLIDGHQRLNTLLEMRKEGIKIPPIPVALVKAHTYKQAKKKVLAAASVYGRIEDQGLYEFLESAAIDIDELVEKIDLPNFDMEKYKAGYSPEGQGGGNTDEDDVPEPPKVAKSKLGDLYQLGKHRLLCGDSTKGEDVDRLFGSARAELCFTSPPYADQREYNGEKNLSTEHLASFIRSAVNKVKFFAVNLGISRKDGEFNQYWDDYIKEAKASGLKLLSWNIWDRSGFGYTVAQATAMFTIDHEWIFVFGESPKKLNRTIENKQSGVAKKGTIRQRDGSTSPVWVETGSQRQMGTIIRMDVARYIGDDHTHPAMFPVSLPEAYLEACSSSGDGIYEPFSGSGSTLIACEKSGRRCFGMEIDPIYCDVIIKRWEDFTGQKAELING